MNRGFTLIELIVSIAIASVITGAIYFSLNTALESWGYSRDQIAMQKVLSDISREISGGNLFSYGLQDALEVIEAGTTRIEFVPPWTDDSHTVASRGFVYTLNRKIRPGSALPITEVAFFDTGEYTLIPVALVDKKYTDVSQVRLGLATTVGTKLRFTYHPDAKANADVIKTIWWDSLNRQIYSEYRYDITNISDNPFGVEVVDFKLKYFDNTNRLISDFDYVDESDINIISGVEIFIKVQLGQHSKSLLGFVGMRNAPTRSGYLSLKQGTTIPIPDSGDIRIFLMRNISGVENGDIVELEATPDGGRAWRVRVLFSRVGFANPKIERYTIEYPPGKKVYTGYPRMSVDVGLNLLTLDSRGLYDYDNDAEIKDSVNLEGDVSLEVTKMDVEGAGLFIRP